MNETIELDRYFERIGYPGPRTPTLNVLHALTAAHSQAIPFENIDVLLGRPIRLEPQALQQKMVAERRGGYCFEQNGLLLAVLTQLGFAARALAARVRLGQPDRRIATQRTHMLIEVLLDGQPWITDVGVGAASLTAALRLHDGPEQTTPHDRRRLQRQGERWYHQMRRGPDWVDVVEFTLEDAPAIDRTVANWYTSTHPDSVFRHGPRVALAQPGGVRLTLTADHVTRREADGTEQRQPIDGSDALIDVLQRVFGIVLPPGTRLAPGHGGWMASDGSAGPHA